MGRDMTSFLLLLLVSLATTNGAGTELVETIRQMIANGAEYEEVNAVRRAETLKSQEAPLNSCYLEITIAEEAVDEKDPSATTHLTCGSDELYSDTKPLSQLKPQSFDNGIRLFSDVSNGQNAFAFLDGVQGIRFSEVVFKNLRPFGGKNLAAPLVIGNTPSINIDEAIFHSNKGGQKAGALYVFGDTSVDLEKADFYDNEGHVGALLVEDPAVLDAQDSVFEANRGEVVGGAMANGGTFQGKELMFVGNVGADKAPSIYYTGKSGGSILHGKFYGEERDDDLETALLADDYDNDQFKSLGLSRAGSIEIDGEAFIAITTSKFENNTGSYGTVLTSYKSVVGVRMCTFTGNKALNGGGVYVNGHRGSYAQVMNSQFENNIARFGGALVVTGNGSFNIDGSNFQSNKAYLGGAVWGDYSDKTLSTEGACPKVSEGSRINIELSEFYSNEAVQDGGAFFIKCTNIYSNSTNFSGNKANRGNGGAVYIEHTFDLHFIDSIFDSNTAGANGGSVYALDSNDIISERTNFYRSTAGSQGGAISSTNGQGIWVTESEISDNIASNGDGGAIHSDKVATVDIKKSEVTNNLAGTSGGALSVHNLDKFAMDRVNVSNNVASEKGGAVRATNGLYAEITKMNITGMAGMSGPISLEKIEDVLVSLVDFSDNKVDDRCGALAIDGASTAELFDLTFYSNIAANDGGALCLTNTKLAEIRDSIFIDNLAGQTGGAIILDNNGEVDISRGEFSDNIVRSNGGAIKGQSVDSLSVEYSKFRSNEAAGSGAAIYLKQSSVKVYRSVFEMNRVGQVPDSLLDNWLGNAHRENAINRAESVGGVLYVAGGKKFISVHSVYSHNSARDVGGSLMLEDMDEAFVQNDTFSENSAAKSGGCIYGNNVANFSLWDSSLTFCSASLGGGFILEGRSSGHGGYNKFINNTAANGGAVLCKGDSSIEMKSTNFSYNVAQSGQTAAIDCRCDIDFSLSIFYRDKHLKDNGDFFHTTKGCGSVNANGCHFYGKKDKDGFTVVQLMLLIIICAVLAFVCYGFIIARRRRKRQAAVPHQSDTDEESGQEALLNPATTTEHKYFSTEEFSTEEYSTEEYTDSDGSGYTESEEAVEDVKGKRKAASARSIVGSDGDEDSEQPKQVVRTRGAPILPVVDPIGVRSAKEQRAAERRRRASMININDGAGPSAVSSEELLPPSMPPVLSLSLSMDNDERRSTPSRSDSKRETPTVEEESVPVQIIEYGATDV